MYKVVFGKREETFESLNEAVMFTNSVANLKVDTFIYDLRYKAEDEEYFAFYYDPETMDLFGLVEVEDLVMGYLSLLQESTKYMVEELNALPMELRNPINIAQLKAFEIFPFIVILEMLEHLFSMGYISDSYLAIRKDGSKLGTFNNIKKVPHIIYDAKEQENVAIIKGENLFRYYVMPYDMILPETIVTESQLAFEKEFYDMETSETTETTE